MSRADKLEVYETQDDQWAWRRKAPNGEIISEGESYTLSKDAISGALRANPDIKPDDVLVVAASEICSSCGAYATMAQIQMNNGDCPHCKKPTFRHHDMHGEPL